MLIKTNTTPKYKFKPWLYSLHPKRLLPAIALGIIIALIIFATSPELTQSFIETKAVASVGNLINDGISNVESIVEPELKQNDSLTSVLIVGVDTRNVEFTGEEFISTQPKGQAGTRNTDTIIQAVYDHNAKRAFLISIPRDMGVDVELDCLEFHGSIHWVYDKAQTSKCPGGGEQVLVDTVEGITGVEIQYYGFVTLEAFEEIINTVGETNEDGKVGIWLDNPTNVWESYPYGETGWQGVFFPQGRIFLDSSSALKYARSRKITTDFGRALRQQLLIEAIKDRVLSTDTLFSPTKIMSLIETFGEHTIYTKPSIEEVRAGFALLSEFEQSDIVNLVLSPDMGGNEVYLNKQPHDRWREGNYYMVPTHWQECPSDEFCRVQEYVGNVIRYPEVYQENAKIFAYARGYTNGKSNFDNTIYHSFHDQRLPLSLSESKFIVNRELPRDIMVIDYSGGKKSETLKVLSSHLGVEVVDGSEYPGLNINHEEITIVVKGD